MRQTDFEAMVARMAADVPPEFLDGVAEILVSPRTVAHPDRPGIFTLGECIPLPAPAGAELDEVQSRVVLYYGSFAALAQITPGFAWREEAFETLTHELRHHLEWRARAPGLEALDRAVEENYARHDGAAFDPDFYRDGEPLGDKIWQVEDDVFVERIVRRLPASLTVRWAARDYVVPIPSDASLPAFLVLEGVAAPPPGELLLALRRKPSLFALLQRAPVYHAVVRATDASDYLPGAEPGPGQA
ncbi:MAG: metallopeptidase family protein [Gemmatimonadales bacterium]